MGERSIEFQVGLGLDAAQSQIKRLQTELQSAVKIDSSSFNSISSSLERALRQVEKLKGGMASAFKTSTGSKRFLQDFDKLFNSINSIGERFGNLGLGDLIFPAGVADQIKDAQEQMKELTADLKRIETGRIGKLFEDSSIDSIKQVRDVASELSVDLSKASFQQFNQKIDAAMTATKQQIADVTKQIETLQNTANGTTLSKDSILSVLQNGDVTAGATSKVLASKDSAERLRAEIADIYKSFSLEGLTGTLGQSIKANSDIKSVFNKQEQAINESSESLQKAIQAKKAQLNKAIEDLMKLGTSNRDPNGTILNAEGKLGFIEKLKEQFSSINFSERQKGEGIRSYINRIVEDLRAGAAQIDATSISKEILDRINDALNNANVKEVISDPKAFGDQVNNAISEAFGTGFKLDPKIFSDFKGSTVQNAFESIATSIRNNIKDMDTAELESRLESLKSKLEQYGEVSKTVSETEKTDAASAKEKSKSLEELSATLAKLVAEQLGLVKGNVGKALGEDADKAIAAKSAMESYIASLSKFEGKQKALSNIQMAVTRWMGFYQVLNLAKRAINDMKQHIQELDTVMTKIAVVTNFSQEDLWNQIGQYSEIARQYGVAIKGVYEVSQLYYQQGLNKGDVMGLTTETLKMARIAGIDYATAADYMTTAIRGFKLEMSDASHVTDVFSNLAAHTASSTEELATAISKTAASAESVGASFEATTAMMSTMIATTRESATNIGTALKSIISRYGEMKENKTGTDEEGEEYSLNKVDKALQSIGIKIHDVNGQFRNFDDVILELAEAWDGVDKNTQRYIATVMAGNRQQSRFLALVGNVEEYKRALELANNAEDTGELQTLKTLDSIDAKIERMKVTIQEFYTSSGIQDLYKGILDTITNVISAANSLPKTFGKIPVMALAIGANIISIVKNVLKLIISSIQLSLQTMKLNTTNLFKNLSNKAAEEGANAGRNFKTSFDRNAQGIGAGILKNLGSIAAQYAGAIVSMVGAGYTLSGMNDYGASTSKDQDIAAGQKMQTGGILGVVGSAVSGAAMGAAIGNIPGAILGGIGGLITGLVSNYATLEAASDMLNVTLAREIELKTKAATNAKNEETKKKGEVSELQSARDKLTDLKESSYSSAEALKEYHEYMNQLAESYPNLISNIEITGNKTIELADLESQLAQSRVKSALATVNAIRAEQEKKSLEVRAFGELYSAVSAGLNPENNGWGAYSYDNLIAIMRANDRTGDPYKEYDRLVKLGAIEGRTIASYQEGKKGFARSAYAQIGAAASATSSKHNQTQEIFEPELKKLYNYYTNKTIKDNTADQQSSLKAAISKILEEEPNLSIMDLTGEQGIQKVSDIDNYSGAQLVNIMKRVQERAKQYMDIAVAEVQNLDNALGEAELQLKIQDNLANDYVKNGNGRFEKYTSLISGLISTEKGVDWAKDQSTETINTEIEEWKGWIVANQEAADWLLSSFDISNYKSAEELTRVLTKEKNLPVEIANKYVDKWVEYMITITNSAMDSVDHYLEGTAADINQIKNLFGETETKRVPARKQLTEAQVQEIKDDYEVYQQQQGATPVTIDPKGEAFKDTFKDKDKAKSTMESWLERQYPGADNAKKLETWYNLYSEYMEQDILTWEDMWTQFSFEDIDITEYKPKLNAELTKSLQTSLKTYNELYKNGQHIAAENYLNSLTSFYSDLGELNDSQQLEVQDVVGDIDFRDSDSLKDAAEQLKTINEEAYSGLAKDLNLAAARIATNVQAQIAQARDKAKDLAKDLENAVANVNKGLKLSEAIENADNIISQYTGKDTLTFDYLYKWDSVLGGYVLTVDGIKTWIETLTKDSQDEINNINEGMKDQDILFNNMLAKSITTKHEFYQIGDEYQRKWLSDDIEATYGSSLTQDQKDAKVAALMEQYDLLSQEYLEDQKKLKANGKVEQTWSEWVTQKKAALDKMSQAEIDFLTNLPKNTIAAQIVSFDFDAIAGGNGENLKEPFHALMEQIVPEMKGQNNKLFESLWSALLSGNIASVDDYLKANGVNITTSDTQKKSSLKAEIQQQTAALDDIMNKPITQWSDETKNLLTDMDKMTDDYVLKADVTTDNLIQTISNNLRGLIDGETYTLDQYNQDILAIARRGKNGFGREKIDTDLLTGGFTTSDFMSYLSDYGLADEIDDVFDFAANKFKEGFTLNDVDLNSIFNYDAESDTFKIDITKTFAQVKDNIMKAFKVSEEKALEIYNSLLDDEIDTTIKNLDNADVGLKSSEQIKNLGSANIGDRVRTDKLSSTVKNKLISTGLFDTIGDYIEITAANQIENAVTALQELLDSGELEPEEASAIQEIISNIKSKTSKTSALQGVIGRTVSQSAAESYAKLFGNANNVEASMTELGFTWNEDIKAWTKNGAETLENIRAKIASLGSDNIQESNELYAMVDALENEDKAAINEAVVSMAQNYQSISSDTIRQLANATGASYTATITKYGLIANGDGTYKLDPSQLRQLLQTDKLTDSSRKAIEQVISGLSDNYISQLSNAIKLTSEGTTSQAEMTKFVQDYNEKTKSALTTSQLFQWDEILDAFTLKPEYIQTYIQGQKEALIEAGFDDSYVNNYIEKIKKDLLQTVNIEDYFKSEHRERTSKVSKLLENQIRIALSSTMDMTAGWEDYLEEAFKQADEDTPAQEIAKQFAEEHNKELLEQTIKADMQSIAAGGQAAINVMRKYSEDGELTAEQIELAYKQRFTSLSTAMDSLETISRNSVVDSATRDILNSVSGFNVNIDGVVQSVGDLTTAYEAIYKAMKQTAVATQIELNSAYVKVLNARESKDIDAISALNDAMGMTYEALSEMLNKYGKSLESVMSNPSNYGIKEIGGGKIQISDFETFAAQMGWDQDSEEYFEAYRSYTDNLIEYGSRIKDRVKEEFDAITTAKAGDQLNVTQLVKSVGQEAMQEFAQTYNAGLENGILTITENTDIPGLIEALSSEVQTLGEIPEAEMQALVQQVKAQTKVDYETAYTSMLQDTSSITIDTIKALALVTKRSFNEIIDSFNLTNNGNGTYKAEGAAILNILATAKESVSAAVYDSLLDSVRQTQDTLLSTINQGTTLSISGSSSLSEMQSFINSYNKISGETAISINDAFSYNIQTGNWLLDAATLKKFVDAQTKQLEALGVSGTAITQYVEDQTKKILRENIDIESYLSAEDLTTKKEEKDKLIDAIEAYKDYLNTDLSEELQNKSAEYIIAMLEQGGEKAVQTLEQLKGSENVSSEEYSSVYFGKINKLREAVDEITKGVGETISATTAAILQQADYTVSDIGGGNYVIEATGNLVDAYIQLYAQMEHTALATTSELNELYAQLLTAQDQQNMDVIDALENASGMTYDVLAGLVSKYSKQSLKEFMDSDAVERTGFGQVRITDWDTFATELFGEDYTDLIDTSEYQEVYNTYLDSTVEMLNAPITSMETAVEQLSGLSELKPGEVMNINTLQKVLKLTDDQFNEYFAEYGAQVENGILQLSAGANIPGLITAIANAAADAGTLIPEQLAELADSVADMISSITESIVNGIEGKLSNADAQKLNEWYRQQQKATAEAAGLKEGEYTIKDLDFDQTAEGLEMSNNAARDLYRTVSAIDSIQGEILFDALKENLIETDDHFKSAQTNTAYIKQTEEDIAALQREEVQFAKVQKEYQKTLTGKQAHIELFDSLKGNTDLYNRPWIDNADGSYSTILGTEYYNELVGEQEVHLMLTPIPEWAETESDILSDEELNAYFQALMDQHPIDVEALLKLDAQGIEINGKHISNMIMDVADAAEVSTTAFHNEALSLHEWSNAWESTRRQKEAPDNSERIAALQQELALAEEINAVRATSQDESFDFMNQDIPAAQNNPLTYWENWQTAYNAINDSAESGYMGYKDFYNLVTEMGNLAEMSGQAIPLGEKVLSNAQDAADLITQAAGALQVTADGSLEIDLSGIGIDFASSAESMAAGVDAGIHDLAQSQVDMLDSLISLLETIVAMEELSDIDIEGDGIDIGNLLTINTTDAEGVVTDADYTPIYDAWRNDMIQKFEDYCNSKNENGVASVNVDLGKAMEGIKFTTTEGSFSFADVLYMEPETLANMSDDFQTAYTTFLDGMVKASLSDDYNLDNIYDSIKTVLAQSGLEDLTIDMGDKTFHFSGNAITVIDWSNEDAINAATSALDAWEANNSDFFKNLPENADIKEKIAAIEEALSGETLEVETRQELQYIIDLASGDVSIQEVKKDGKTSYRGTYKNQHFTADSRKDAEDIIKRAASTEAEGFKVTIDPQTCEVTGSLKINGTIITVSYDADNNETYSALGKSGFTSKEAAIEYCISQGYADSAEDGYTYNIDDNEYGGSYQIIYNKTLGITCVLRKSDGKYVYKGRTFDSQDSLSQYVTDIEPLLNKKEWTVKPGKGKDSGFEFITNDTATIKRNISTGEVEITADGMTFQDIKSMGEYLAMKTLAKSQEGKGGSITLTGKGDTRAASLTFIYQGQSVTLEVDQVGTMTYTCNIEGATITAYSEAGLKAGLAAHAAMKAIGEGGSLNDVGSANGDGNLLFTYTAGSVTVEVDLAGNVVTSNGLSAEDAKKVEDAVNQSTSETPVDVTATVANIEADASGATVTITPSDGLKLSEVIPKVTGTVATLELNALSTIGKGATDNINVTLSEMPDLTVDANVEAAIEKINKVKQEAKEAEMAITGNNKAAIEAVNSVKSYATNNSAIQAIKVGTNEVPGKVDSNVTYAKKHPAKQDIESSGGGGVPAATGNVGLASGNAFAHGTLMGELGPELVVSQGRYFVVGQSGPEMVNLEDDAIVFNHLQTQSLLRHGTSPTRGHAITNEQTAVAYAQGNITGGPAMASASAALAALKQLRAMWASLAEASVKDLAGKGGGGGGGGGGGDPKAFIKELERWYDWLQHIAQLEKEINYEEALRNKISSQWVANGREYYNSQVRTLNALKEQLSVQASLTQSQEAYFEKRRKELNEQSAFSALYGFSETGQLYYKDVYADGKSAFEWLSDLAGRDATTGEANYTAEEQYNKLVAAGFGFAMKYDSSGNEIKQEGDDWYNTAVQAFWDKIDADKEEMQSLHDSVEEGYTKLEELEQQQNEIIQEMRDNQMELEEKVYDAIVEIRQRVIDELKDTKDAIKDSNDKFIKGLTDALNKEQQMYNNAQSRQDLDRLRRQRDILVSSGGSASEIASLNKQISDKEQSIYFDKQQEQIDAIQDASDKQIEKLEAQIKIETELLDYQKKYGLLWAEVTEIMGKSPEEIARFIAQNTEAYWNKSPVATADEMNKLTFSAQQWVGYRDGGALSEDIQAIRKKLLSEGESEQGSTTGEDKPTTTEGKEGGGAPSIPTVKQPGPEKQPTGPTKKKLWKVYDDRGIETNYIIEAYNEADAKKILAESYGSYLHLGSETTQKDKDDKDNKRKKIEQEMKELEEARQKAKEPTVLEKIGSGVTDFFDRIGSFFGFNPQKKAGGGYVDHGLYELGELGTETVLTASQTKVLHDNILSNRPSSLISLLKSYNEAYNGLSPATYDSLNNQSTITQIDKAEINLHIDKLANDYDSRQAANTIMDEMLRIASKTKANNSVRR